MNIAVLCGGKGKRMGGINKGLLKINGKYFVEIIYEEMSQVGDVVIIGNSEEFKTLNLNAVDDIIKGCGPLCGLFTAFEYFKGDVFLTACDMPLVSKEAALYLKEVQEEFKCETAVFYTEKISPIPGVFSYLLKEKVKRRIKEGRLSLTGLVLSSMSVVIYPREHKSLLSINTPEDYEKLKISFENN